MFPSNIAIGYLISHAIWTACILPLFILSILQWISDRHVSHSFEVRRQTIGYTKLIFHRLQLFASTLCIVRCIDPEGAYRLLTTGEVYRFLSANTTACIVAAGAVAVVTMIDSLYGLMSRPLPTWSPRIFLLMIIFNFIIANANIIYALVINREWPTGIFLICTCVCFFIELILINIALTFLRRHLSRQLRELETCINPLGYVPPAPIRPRHSLPPSQRSSTFHSRNGSNDSDPDMIYHPPTLPEYPPLRNLTQHQRQLSTDSLDVSPSQTTYRSLPASYNLFGAPSHTYMDPQALAESQSTLTLQSQAIATAMKKMTLTQFIGSVTFIITIVFEIMIAKNRLISVNTLVEAHVDPQHFSIEPFQWMHVVALILIIWYAWIPLKFRPAPAFPLLEEDLLSARITTPVGNLNPDLQIPIETGIIHDDEDGNDGYDSDQERIGRTTRQPHGQMDESGQAATYTPSP